MIDTEQISDGKNFIARMWSKWIILKQTYLCYFFIKYLPWSLFISHSFVIISAFKWQREDYTHSQSRWFCYFFSNSIIIKLENHLNIFFCYSPFFISIPLRQQGQFLLLFLFFLRVFYPSRNCLLFVKCLSVFYLN